MISGVTIKTSQGSAAYCLDCKEYRSTVLVQMNFKQLDKNEYKTVIKCSDCNSRNLKILESNTGLKARTET